MKSEFMDMAAPLLENPVVKDNEVDIIKKHMWPLTVIPPKHAEYFLVSMVDTFCSTKDYINIKQFNKININL